MNVTIHRRFPGPVRSVVHVEPARLAVAAGLRVAVALLVPLMVGRVLNVPAAMWASIAGYSVVLADKGGSYRTRAATMAALTALAAISAVIAALAGAVPWLAALLALLWGVVTSFGRVYGAGGSSVGLSTAIIFVISLALPTRGAAALERGGLILLGGAWAMLLTLALWPLRPYRPARLAVARCYRALAEYAADAATPHVDQDKAEWQVHVQGDRARIREALEQARVVLAEQRRGRQEESGRGARLIVLLEAGDQIFAQVLALADLLEGVVRGAPVEPAYQHRAVEGVRRAMLALATTAREIANVVEEERERAIAVDAVDWGMGLVQGAIDDASGALAAGRPASFEKRATYEHLAHLVVRLHEYAGVAAEVAATLDSERPVPAAAALPIPHVERRSAIEPLLATLAPHSEVLRHALRVGIATAAAVLIARLLGLPHGYWMTIAVLVILQPYTGATLVKGAQRVVGTVAGGIIAAALAAVIHDPRGIMLLVAVLAATAVMLLPLNYGMFVVLLTPAFVLLVEVSEGNWSLAGTRILNTVLGGALAALAARLLWPSPERERFPERAAAALRAARDYLARVGATFSQPVSHAPSDVTQMRRQLGLAVANAEASFQRLLTESPGTASAVGRLEPGMTLLIYTRRLGAAITTLASLTGDATAVHGAEQVEALVRTAGPVLEDLAESVAGARAPKPLPEMAVGGAMDVERAPEGMLLHTQLHRVVRPIVVLHDAVMRLADESTLG